VQQSKRAAVLVLIAAFGAGGAVGVAADRLLHIRHLENQCGMSYLDQITHDWHLSPAQRQSIDAIMDRQHQQITVLYKPLTTQMDSLGKVADHINDSTQRQIRAVLTPEQLALMDSLRADEKRRAERFKSTCKD